MLWHSNVLQGLTIPVPCMPRHTHHRPGLTASVSICSITGSCTTTTMRRKEPGSQSRRPPDKPGTSRPLPILVLLILACRLKILSCRHGAGLHSPAPGAALRFPWLPSCPQYSQGFAEQYRDLEAERTWLPAHPQPHARAKSAGKACFHLVHRGQLEEGLFSSKSA